VAFDVDLHHGGVGHELQRQQVTLMTGPQGGVWVPLGGALKNMWEKAIPGLQCRRPGAGIANVRGVDEGKADIGFGNSSIHGGRHRRRAPYPQKVTKVCQVANLYPQYFQVVALANSGVNSVRRHEGQDLVAVQPKGNTAEPSRSTSSSGGHELPVAAKVNFVNSYTDAASMLKDGHAQVFTLGTTIAGLVGDGRGRARDIRWCR
jgi:uncharacterized protein